MIAVLLFASLALAAAQSSQQAVHVPGDAPFYSAEVSV